MRETFVTLRGVLKRQIRRVCGGCSRSLLNCFTRRLFVNTEVRTGTLCPVVYVWESAKKWLTYAVFVKNSHKYVL